MKVRDYALTNADEDVTWPGECALVDVRPQPSIIARLPTRLLKTMVCASAIATAADRTAVAESPSRLTLDLPEGASFVERIEQLLLDLAIAGDIMDPSGAVSSLPRPPVFRRRYPEAFARIGRGLAVTCRSV